MNVECSIAECEIRKRVFFTKTVNSDGLVFQVNHTVLSNQNHLIRFVNTCFNKTSNLLAAGDHAGNIFIINYIQNKFWKLPKSYYMCTVLKFSPYANGSDIVLGASDGSIFLISTETGNVIEELLGHSAAVKDISFANDRECLTMTEIEVILWDLQNYTKLQVLNVNPASRIKIASFMPVTNNIMVCFDDDTISVWKYRTYEVVKQILPSCRNRLILKSIAFTRNGRAMVLGGHSSQLMVFTLYNWAVVSIITLPESILSIRKIQFLPHLFDGGSNRVLIILSGSGTIYFYDMEDMSIISKVTTDQEITKFDCSLDGKYISCILKSGDINMYKIAPYLPRCKKSVVVKEKPCRTQSINHANLTAVKKRLKEVLDLDKLKGILGEFGEYPDSYRLIIWTQLLELPNNHRQYNHFINHATHPSFANIKMDYPLENKTNLKNLRKLLHNLVTWSPFFSQVSYLPVFVFPFVKVFQNEPVLCFEGICTIIVNWCQHWFQYFPLPPLNTLSMIENVIFEHSSELLSHFTYHNITTNDYAWPLLESAFSEALTTKEWSTLWDHILSNEPAFLLMTVAAYNILNRETLLFLQKHTDFDTFFHSQNVINIKKLINKTYYLLQSTSEQNHPRRYLKEFRKLEHGSYLSFDAYPKFLFNLDCEVGSVQMEQENLQKAKVDIMNERELVEKYLAKDDVNVIDEVETKRLEEMEKLCQNKIKQERQQVADERRHLADLRKQLHQKEIDIVAKSLEKAAGKTAKQKEAMLQKLINEVEQSHVTKEIEVAKAESELFKHYSQLLLYRMQQDIKADTSTVETNTEYEVLKRHQQELAEELQKIRLDRLPNTYLEQLNVVTSIAAIDDLTTRIETELLNVEKEKTDCICKPIDKEKVLKLKVETKELEMEVSSLLHTLSQLKASSSKVCANEKCNDVLENFNGEQNLKTVPSKHDFKRLKCLIQEMRSYECV